MRLVALALCLLHLAVVTVAGGSLACTCADGSRAIELAGCGCPAAAAMAVEREAAGAVSSDDCCDECGRDDASVSGAPAAAGTAPELRAPGCRKDLPALHAGVGYSPTVLSHEGHPAPPGGELPEPCTPCVRPCPDPAGSPPVPLRC